MHALRSDLVVVPLLGLLLAGCATTRVVSQRDPSLAHQPYRIVMIDAALGDPVLSRAVEQAFVQQMLATGSGAFGASELFFSLRDYTTRERDEIYNRNGVQAVLVLRPAGSGITSQYVPPTRRSTTTVEETEDGYRETTVEVHGGGFERPTGVWATHVAELYDLRSGEIVWYAEANSEGRGTTNWERVARSAGKQLARQLDRDRLLERRSTEGILDAFHRANTVESQ